MDPGEQTTGTRDEHYNLISVLYHALHGAETIEVYALDAEAAGDERLAAFFRDAQAMQLELAERAKELLGIGLEDAAQQAPPERGLQPEAPPESGVTMDTALPGEDVAPPGEVPPDAPRTGEVPPRTGDAPPSPSEPPGQSS